MFYKRKNHYLWRGFTLVEITVSLAVLALFTLFAYRIFAGGSLAVRTSIDRTIAYASASEALNLVSRAVSYAYITAAQDIYFLYGSNTPSSFLNWKDSRTAPSAQAELCFTGARDKGRGRIQEIYEIGFYLNDRNTPHNPADDVLEQYLNADPPSWHLMAPHIGKHGGKTPAVSNITDFRIQFAPGRVSAWRHPLAFTGSGRLPSLLEWDSRRAANLTSSMLDDGKPPCAVLVTISVIGPSAVKRLNSLGILYSSRNLPGEDAPEFEREKITVSAVISIASRCLNQSIQT